MPFNEKEIQAIKKPLLAQDWSESNSLSTPLKFFVSKKERVINLSIEHDILPPFNLRGFFPLGRVKFSFIGELGLVSADLVEKLSKFWSKDLKQFGTLLQGFFDLKKIANLNPSPEIKNKIATRFMSKLPEPMADKDENYFFKRIRLHFSRRKDALDYASTKKLVATLKDINILPTNKFDDIPELRKGLTPSVVDRLLIFKNPDFQEVVFLEPGFITYFRDIEVENVKLRIYFDSFAIEPLITFWKYDFAAFLEPILRNLRLAFGEFLKRTRISEFKKVYFVQKNFELFCRKYLKNFDPVKDPDQKELAFPIPNVIFEIARASTLIFPSWNIFIKPPESMEELQARRVYENTRTQAKQGNFTETIAALSKILPVFNKTGQKYAFYLVLLELGRLALKVGDYDQVQKKFDLAINFAEKNEGIVSQDEYIQIQEELADAHVKFKNYDNAVRQLTILYNYLERSKPASDTKLPDILIKLNKIFIMRDDSESLDFEIQKYFKKIKDFADKQKNKVVTAQYYHTLGLYYKKRGKLSSAISNFKKGIAEAQDSPVPAIEIAIILDLSSIYLYGKKKNHSLALKYLTRANEIVGKSDNLVQELKIYDMLHDLYNQADDMELAGYYNQQSQKLRMALKTRGLL